VVRDTTFLPNKGDVGKVSAEIWSRSGSSLCYPRLSEIAPLFRARHQAPP
jgi:hypothetical protein